MPNNANATLPPIVLFALHCYRQPGHHLELLKGNAQLPEGVEVLLSFALKHQAGHGVDGIDGKELYEASMFFIENVLLAKNASHYRILGLSQYADDTEIKSHHRLMIRLFHPDRVGNDDLWRLDFAPRINAAYNTLIHPEARRMYDRSMVVLANVNEVHNSHRSNQKLRTNTSLIKRHPWWMGLPSLFLRHPSEALLTSTALIAAILIWFVFDGQRRVDSVDGKYSGSYEEVSYDESTKRHVDEVKKEPVPIASQARNDSPGVGSNEAPSGAHAAENVALIKAGPVTFVEDKKKVTPSTDTLTSSAKDRDDGIGGGKENPVQSSPAKVNKDVKSTTQEIGRPDDALKQERFNKPEVRSISAQTLPAPVVEKSEAAGLPIKPAGMALQSINSEFKGGNQNAQNDFNLQASSKAIAAEPTNDVEVVNALLSQFIRSYESGNLPGFMAVFSPHVVTDGGGLEFIREDYSGLFKSTQKRQLMLKGMSWAFKQNIASGQGRYTAKVVNIGGTDTIITNGRLMIEVSNIRSKPLISSINYTTE